MKRRERERMTVTVPCAHQCSRTRSFQFTSRFLILVFGIFLVSSIVAQSAVGSLSADTDWQSSSADSATRDDAFQRGLIALREDRCQEALEELTTAESKHPLDATVRTFRGTVLARLGRNAE